MNKKTCLLIVMLFSLFCVINCGGGGGGGGGSDTPVGSPDLVFSNSSGTYDFQTVAVGGSASAQMTVFNNGSANLEISTATISGSTNFLFGSNQSLAPVTVAAGESFTISLVFSPTDAVSYAASLNIVSNDAQSPHEISLIGKGEFPSTASVDLNQIQLDCDSNTLQALVNVTDQNGFSIENLDETNFTLANGNPITEFIVQYLDTVNFDLPISVTLVMDYSGSITDWQPWVVDMQTAASTFVENLDASDEAEIIKFGTTPVVVQSFTTDKSVLTNAINGQWDATNNLTALYDASFLAIEETIADASNQQRAIVVLTDGIDTDGTQTLSTHTVEEVIDLAKSGGVRIFTIGIGTNTDDAVLSAMAEETGGQYFNPDTTMDLTRIYEKLIRIFNNIYVITCNPSTSTGAESNFSVTVNVPGLAPASDSLSFTPCSN